MTPLARRCWDNRNLSAKMQRAGWVMRGDETICVSCAEDEGDDAVKA